MMRPIRSFSKGPPPPRRGPSGTADRVFFQGGGVSVDSWTPGPKCRCHRHRTGPHPSGLLWTPGVAGGAGPPDGRRSTHPALDHVVGDLDLRAEAVALAGQDPVVGEIVG